MGNGQKHVVGGHGHSSSCPVAPTNLGGCCEATLWNPYEVWEQTQTMPSADQGLCYLIVHMHAWYCDDYCRALLVAPVAHAAAVGAASLVAPGSVIGPMPNVDGATV